MGCWFTVDFCGSTSRVVLSTGPEAPGTHWYQCRMLLSTPIAVNVGQTISGSMHFTVNAKFSYDIQLKGKKRKIMMSRIETISISSTRWNHCHFQEPYSSARSALPLHAFNQLTPHAAAFEHRS